LAVAILLSFAVRHGAAQCVPTEPTGGSIGTLAPAGDADFGVLLFQQPRTWLTIRSVMFFSKQRQSFGAPAMAPVRSSSARPLGKQRG
jgi:hypothetical protein